jgi:hypothetical protein
LPSVVDVEPWQMTSCAATDGQCSINLIVSEQSKQPVVVVSDPGLMRHKGQNRTLSRRCGSVVVLIPYAASRITCSLNGSRNSEPNPWSCRLVLRGTLPQHMCGTALCHSTGAVQHSATAQCATALCYGTVRHMILGFHPLYI